MKLISMENSEIPHMDDLTLVNILTRLPIESIVRLMSTCRRWYEVISSPHFIKTHLRSPPQQKLAILYSRDPPASLAIRSIHFYGEPNEHHQYPQPLIIDLHREFKYSYPDAKILCSMDGLLLVAISEKTFFVWNPSIRQYKQVGGRHFESPVRIIGGIGYDRLVDEYKLVMVCQVQDKTFVDCFPLGETRLKTFTSSVRFPYRIGQEYSRGVVVDGCPHWIVTRKMGNSPVIIRFDFVQGAFVELDNQPDFLFDDSELIEFDLVVLGGLLCLVCHKTRQVEIWVMMQRDGWFESRRYMYKAPYNPELQNARHLMPLSYTENGDVLMEIDGKELWVYRHKEGPYRLVGYSHNDSGSKVAVYVESLVSPHGNYGRRQWV